MNERYSFNKKENCIIKNGKHFANCIGHPYIIISELNQLYDEKNDYIRSWRSIKDILNKYEEKVFEQDLKIKTLQKNLDIMIQIFDESGLDYCIMTEEEFEEWEKGDSVRGGDEECEFMR